jgi:chromosome segregation ATPase
MATTPNPDLPDVDKITTKGKYSVFDGDDVKEARSKIQQLRKKREKARKKAEQHEKQARTLRSQLGEQTVKEELGEAVGATSAEDLRTKIQEHKDAAQEARQMAQTLAGDGEGYENIMNTAEEVAQEYESAIYEELDELIESFAEHAQALVTLNQRIAERIDEIDTNNQRQRHHRENSRDRRGEITMPYTQKVPYMPSLLPGKAKFKRLKSALSEQGYSIEA